MVRPHSKESVLRIDPRSVQLAVAVIRKYFGDDAAVWLFGSRADDRRKGGDLDLYVETGVADIALPAARARGALADTLGRHVDLVVNNPMREEPIYAVARAQGVRLA